MSAKPVNWGLIEYGDELYSFTNGLLEKYHGNPEQPLVESGDSEKPEGSKGSEEPKQKYIPNIILMWRYNVKPDQDGYILLANISKSSDQVRELRPHDFIIGINKDVWDMLDAQQKTVVIDSQLERIAICLDKDDNVREDDHGRVIYRLKKQQVIDEQILQRRHGLTLHEVQEYVCDVFSRAGSEKGSYVDKVLSEPE